MSYLAKCRFERQESVKGALRMYTISVYKNKFRMCFRNTVVKKSNGREKYEQLV